MMGGTCRSNGWSRRGRSCHISFKPALVVIAERTLVPVAYSGVLNSMIIQYDRWLIVIICGVGGDSSKSRRHGVRDV
jgi:hypothetical protein